MYNLVITRSQMTQTSHSQRKHRIHCTTISAECSVLTLSNKLICINLFFPKVLRRALVLWLRCGRWFWTSALVVDHFRHFCDRTVCHKDYNHKIILVKQDLKR